MAKTTSKNPQVGKITDEEERKKALSNTLGAIEKQFGKGAIMKLGEKTAMNVQTIPSGCLELDIALGVGGVLMLLLNNPKRNPLINLGAGLWDLYNNLTGLLSDVLSYIRLFAIGLSGGVLALVFNTLASGFVPEGANIVVRLLIMIPILLIGHGINLFMSTISSFVHPLRLTFVEFFKNAGFEMAPRNFDPIRKMNDTNE